MSHALYILGILVIFCAVTLVALVVYAHVPDLHVTCPTPDRVGELVLEIPNDVLSPGMSGALRCVNFDAETGARKVSFTLPIHFVPEPSTGLLLAVGLPFVLALNHWRNR